jgi:hypothetical protein
MKEEPGYQPLQILTKTNHSCTAVLGFVQHNQIFESNGYVQEIDRVPFEAMRNPSTLLTTTTLSKVKNRFCIDVDDSNI